MELPRDIRLLATVPTDFGIIILTENMNHLKIIKSDITHKATNTMPISKMGLARNKEWGVQVHKICPIARLCQRECMPEFMSSLHKAISAIDYRNLHYTYTSKSHNLIIAHLQS